MLGERINLVASAPKCEKNCSASCCETMISGGRPFTTRVVVVRVSSWKGCSMKFGFMVHGRVEADLVRATESTEEQVVTHGNDVEA